VAGAVVWELIKRSPGEPGQAVVLAGEAVVDAWPGGVDGPTKDRGCQALQKTMTADRRVQAAFRVAAGAALAKLNDERPGVALVEAPGQTPLPDIEFCYIPAGPFWLGSSDGDDQAYDDEKPLHQLDLPDYWLSRYPVTVAQFRAFVTAGGYKNPAYWTEAQAHGAWRAGKVIRGLYKLEDNSLKQVGTEEAEAPYDFGEPYNLPNHPVVGVTWYEALAFCRWLEERVRDEAKGRRSGEPMKGEAELVFWAELVEGRLRLTLPSEAEWEKAARGGLENPAKPLVMGGGMVSLSRSSLSSLPRVLNASPQRRYPWGAQADPNRANYEDTGIKTSSAVGCFLGGASPYGCEDMSGNIWEWTRSLWGEDLYNAGFGYPYDPMDGREDLMAGTNVLRVLRGGSFGSDERMSALRFASGSSQAAGAGTSVFGWLWWGWPPFSSEL
jgi:formylglycine-generating enzyme required for sulfatase activity